MQVTRNFTDAMLRQYGNLLLWVPVAFGTGVGVYFALPFEPPLLWAGIGAVVLSALVRFSGAVIKPLFGFVAIFCVGLFWAGARAQMVAAPVLQAPYSGAVMGRVVTLDRSASDAPRVTLDRVVLYGAPAPDQVRIALHGDQPPLMPGAEIMVAAHLSAPGGAIEPGGFDFQRHAWFAGLGAVGYARTPAIILSQPSGLGLAMTRHRLSQEISTRIGGDAGAFAAAITMGDRAGLSAQVVDQLRATNLSHLLAISGLHMGLLTGFVFVGLRVLAAMVPYVALRLPVKKIAACGAIFVGAIYLALSGVGVATERAFVMVSVMFAAIVMDRRALTLRAVAVAAMIVLLRRPETVTGPGFQMSFAATTALVAVFAHLRDLRGWQRVVVPVVVSSVVAGLATAPFAMAHFNQVARLGLLANLICVPVMGSVVMPAAVLAAVLAPVGLAAPALWVMKQGLTLILWVAGHVAAVDWAVGHVVAPGPWALPLIAMGGLWMVLWQGWGRIIGIGPIIVALIFWAQADRPDVLITANGRLVGVMGAEGRAVSREKGEGFAAQLWLENDGAPMPQDMAAKRQGWIGGRGIMRAHSAGHSILHVVGARSMAMVAGCGKADILITDQPGQGGRPCLVFDANSLAQTGAVGIDFTDQGITVTTSREQTGPRIWNTPALRDQ